MKPLLKWPGGKRRLISNILQHVPEHYNRYYEPFCGGAALFFDLEPEQSSICDINQELIACYRSMATETKTVIKGEITLLN